MGSLRDPVPARPDPIDLDDCYRLEGEIGRGGMATVYLAQDLKHDRAVAFKLFTPEAARTMDARRFRREISTAARLQHPHICGVYDSGESGGRLWFTMPYVRGESVRDRLRRAGPLPVAEALRITRQVAQALAYAHREGFIHRDVKPENILLTEDGVALLADFGVARSFTRPSSGEYAAHDEHGVGTPAYMAPEQVLGEPADPRADQYSLAATCYEMLAGTPPQQGLTPQAVLAGRFTSDLPSVCDRRPEVSAPVAGALRKALSLRPDDRFRSIEEFSVTLARAEAHGRLVLRRTWAAVSVALALLVVVLVSRRAPAAGPESGSAARSTTSLTAYDAFQKGEALSHGDLANDPPSLRRALVFYEHAVAADPTFVPAWAQVARTSAQLFASGAPTRALAERAREASERARRLGPNRPETYLALGAYYRGVLNDPHRALDAYEAGLRLAPKHGELLAAAGVAEQVAGRWNVALTQLGRAAKLDPGSARAVRRYAEVLLSLHRYDEADQAIDRAMGLAPTSVGIFQTKVMIAVARGDLSAAHRLVRAAPATVDSTELIAYFAGFEDMWWVLSQDQQRRVLTLSPEAFDGTRATWGLVLAQVLQYRGDTLKARAYADSAVQDFHALVREAPNDGQSRALFGLALAYAGRTDEALLEGTQAMALQPMSRDAFMGPYIQQIVARIYLMAGLPDSALDLLEPVLQAPGTLSPGWLRLDPTWQSLRRCPRFQRLVSIASR